MIAEIVPQAYDSLGRKVLRPDWRRKGLHPTFPMGRYFSQPLTINCRSIKDIREFLSTCRAVSDRELFGKDDYWQPPEHFEKARRGDCDDFALWTWRQFLSLGYEARFVFGHSGRYGIGHAWVEFFEGEKCFLVEPQMRVVGDRMPRLSTLRYHPKFSVAWDARGISFYTHEKRHFNPSAGELIGLISEWLVFWAWFWLKNFHRVPLACYRLLKSRLVAARKRQTAAQSQN